MVGTVSPSDGVQSPADPAADAHKFRPTAGWAGTTGLYQVTF
jgi:hypothetical protein